MINLDEYIDKIDEKKEDIARAISLAVAEGDEKKAERYFSSFYISIKESKVFIFKDENFPNMYKKSVDSLIKEISEYIKQGINKSGEDDTYTGEVSKKDEKILKKKYRALEKTFKQLKVSYDDFRALYKNNDMKYIINFCFLVGNLEKKCSFYNLKSKFSVLKSSVNFFKATDQLFEIIEEYNIKSIDDLMDFYTELCSYLYKFALGDENAIKFNEENIESFTNRIKCKENLKDINKLKELKLSLEKVYDNELMEVFLKNTNFKDFFNRYNIRFTWDNFRKIRDHYFYCQKGNIGGFHCIQELDGNISSLAFFPSQLVNAENRNKANNIIIHEFIH